MKYEYAIQCNWKDKKGWHTLSNHEENFKDAEKSLRAEKSNSRYYESRLVRRSVGKWEVVESKGNDDMKEKNKIMSMPPERVKSVLANYNAWRRGEAPFDGEDRKKFFTNPNDARMLGWFIDRAIILLEDMNKLQEMTKRKKGNANESRNRNEMSNKKGKVKCAKQR